MKVISWHPVLTDHQSYTLAALQQAASCNLAVYVASVEHPSRQEQGWVNQHAASLSPKLIPQKGWLKYIILLLKENRDSVHIFSSPFETPKMIITLFFALVMKGKVFLISEPYSPISKGYQNDKHKVLNRTKSLLRPILYRFYGAIISQRIAGVFAISNLAATQYKSIGVSKEKIFPFGYFVPNFHPRFADAKVEDSEKAILRIIFIGTLIKRKGLDVLIDAMASLNKDYIVATLDVYGSGDSTQFDFDKSVIKYCGLIPFGKSQTVIAKYDVLVLPSRYDGWGVVVNEAIMAGVPVLCSNQVGAGEVVKKWSCGAIFNSEDVLDLEKKLNEFVVSPEYLLKARIATQNASEVLNPEVAGRYMLDVIRASFLSEIRVNISSFWGD